MIRLTPDIKNKFEQLQNARIDILNDLVKRINILENQTINTNPNDNSISIMDEHDHEIADIKMTIKQMQTEMATISHVNALIEDIQQTFETYMQTPRTNDDNLTILYQTVKSIQDTLKEHDNKINNIIEELKTLPKLVERRKSSLTLNNFEKAIKK